MSFQPSALSYADAIPTALQPVEWFGPLRAENKQPSTPDGTKLTRNSAPYNAVAAQIAANYGPFPAGILYREVFGVKVGTPLPNKVGQLVLGSSQDGYVYRQYKTGEIAIQVSPKTKTDRTTGGGTTGGGTTGGDSTGGGTGGGTTKEPELPELPSTEGTDWKRIALLYGLPTAVIGISFGVYWFYGRKK